MSSAYYKKIHEKFSKVHHSSSQVSVDWYETNSTASDLMPPPSNTTKDSSGIININMKKRDSKFESKSNEKWFQNYIESKNCIAEIT